MLRIFNVFCKKLCRPRQYCPLEDILHRLQSFGCLSCFMSLRQKVWSSIASVLELWQRRLETWGNISSVNNADLLECLQSASQHRHNNALAKCLVFLYQGIHWWKFCGDNNSMWCNYGKKWFMSVDVILLTSLCIYISGLECYLFSPKSVNVK